MSYAVKEIFLTLQGEGVHTGRRAVFLRFAGCNLWSGREQDRDTAVCRFCDTDFVGTDGEGGGKFATAAALVNAVAATWGDVTGGTRYVVITGGEPLLQLDTALIDALTHTVLKSVSRLTALLSPRRALTGSASARRRAAKRCSAAAMS